MQAFGRPSGAYGFISCLSQDCVLAFDSDFILGYSRSLPTGALPAARLLSPQFSRIH